MNIDRFNWPQMFNNSKGKTSASLFCGTVLLLSATINISVSVIIGYTMLIMETIDTEEVTSFSTMIVVQSLAEAAFGGSLLGIHRLSKDKPVEEDKKEDQNCEPVS